MRILDLTGEWTLRQADTRKTLPAAVPGCVHTDLMKAGRIPDPFYREQELDVQWVSETDWIYARDFDVPAALLAHDRVRLVCEGLDTLATLTLNGRRIGTADNQFRTWTFDVKRALKPGVNRIEIRFATTAPVIARLQKKRRLDGVQSTAHEQRGRGYMRKSQCNYGWDWGPALPTFGIWRPLRLEAFSGARIAEVSISQAHTKQAVDLEVRAEVEKARPQPLAARITVAHGGRVVGEHRLSFRGGSVETELRIRDPRLWWPNGLGAQPLYEVRVELLDAHGTALDSVVKRIGLRTVHLDRQKDAWGESFRFVVNGVPFFAKGANWIPADHFPTRVTRERYADLLQSAAQANMNMLRVWGGGIYEEDVFFDLCDELGLLIWHDFMFACSTYPVWDAAFHASVKAEAEDNVRRIRHHPSLALWCGNNELEHGGTTKTMPWKEYGEVFDRLLPQVVSRLDPQTDYWPSSPHSPHGDRGDSSNPQWGDAHLWAVWHGRQPFEWYRTAFHRFCSEFGFQSFPEPATVRAYTQEGDRNVTTPVMEHHQRSRIGNTAIMQYMLDWFRLPRNFEMTLWASQMLQALSMKYAVEHWRRNMPRCMGALYWQLNDVWPVASWASIDYFGRWKALQLAARRFFSPELISGVEDGQRKTIEIHVTNDRRQPFKGTARWSLATVSGKRLAEDTFAVAVPAGCSRKVMTLELREAAEQFGERRLLVWMELLRGGKVVSSNLVCFAKPKTMALEPPAIRCAVSHLKGGKFRVTLKAAKPALFAWLEMRDPDARFSDNFFHIAPGAKIDVDVTPSRPKSLAEFRRTLSVRSLIDTF